MNPLKLLRWILPVVAVAEATAVVRNLSGRTAAQALNEVRHHLMRAAQDLDNHVLFDNMTSLDSSLKDQTLFQIDLNGEQRKRKQEVESERSISIVCTTCYIKGNAGAKLTMDTSFNLTETMETAKDEFEHIFDELVDYGKEVVKSINVTDMEDWSIPPPHIDFDVSVKGLPEAELTFVFKDVDVYVAMDVVLTSGLTYTLTLYSSHELGVQVNEHLFVGAVLSIDIVLSVESEIDISSGFHIKFDDDVVMKMALFAQEASSLSFNGGQFEFLPVEIETSGVVFTAVLRIQVRSGFSFPGVFSFTVPVIGDSKHQIGAGMEARAFANIAQFTTNVTTNIHARDGDGDCGLNVAQDYQFAVGAAAGASLVVLGQTLGPTPSTQVPIFSTGLASSCLVASKATTTAKAVEARATDSASGDPASETLTHETEVTYEALACASTGLINCPASLQTQSRHVTSTILTTVVPSGADVTWASTPVVTIAALPFGKAAMTMTASSGKPKSYVPPPPTSTSGKHGSQSTDDAGGAKSVVDGETGGVSNKVIIGVSVGLGVPVVAAVVVGACLLWRRKRYTPVPSKPSS